MNTHVAKALVLIIDDETAIRRLIKVTLESDGYRVAEAPSGEEGIRMAATHRPDVVLLDLNLPDIGGIEVLKRLREWFNRAILILSVINEEETIVAALDLGADDYIPKPFGAKEILARIRACLRHQYKEACSPLFTSGDLAVDLASREVSSRGQRLKLTLTEYDVLKILVQNAGKVLTHKHIITGIWGPRGSSQLQNLRVVMTRLRHKIEADPDKPQLLLTEPGVGYRLAVVKWEVPPTSD